MINLLKSNYFVQDFLFFILKCPIAFPYLICLFGQNIILFLSAIFVFCVSVSSPLNFIFEY